ncbi:MAG: YigZ family protein [Bacteroidia bacterium]|nr:YigZ family protein [Bacteroidia bacterium]
MHSDANHVCYGARMGETGEISKWSDDGEPTHSAGLPTLRTLKSERLTMAMIVVVRYFGGNKLGISGLINTYQYAAQNAIDQNQTIKSCIPMQTLCLTFSYSQTPLVQKILKQIQGIQLIQEEFGLNSYQEFLFPKESVTQLQTYLQALPLEWEIK